jgi:hypothetical protein
MYGVLKSIGVHDLPGVTDHAQNDLGASGSVFKAVSIGLSPIMCTETINTAILNWGI